jgi:pimeloyl-ACP methyl ester carboxylesterase
VGLIPALVTGSGDPVTVAAHGLGASLAETRPLLSGVDGRRVFYAARGHAGDLPAPFGYDDLGADLLAVADEHGASRALGVSMGAGALLSLLAAQPDRFERVVLFLPGALDRPRTDHAVRRLAALADALETGAAPEVAELVRAELPADVQDVAAPYVAARAAFLLASPGVAVAVRSLPEHVPVRDRSVLGAVTAQVLLLAQEDDPLHPAQVARDLAAVLPNARLVVFDQPGVLLRERRRLRDLVSGFLNA